MRRPRALKQGAAQAMVSPRMFSRAKIAASREGKATGSVDGARESAGPLSFLKISQIFAFIARRIFGAK